MPIRNMNKPRLLYLFGRGTASIGALVFAFSYSSQLGLVNRSLIAFVMTSNALILITLTSGTTLTLRKLRPGRASGNLLRAFLRVILLEISVGLVLYSFLLATYSFTKTTLPINLVIFSLVYFICSAIHLIVIEILVALKNFSWAGTLEFITIVIQISTFLLINHLEIVSIAMALLFSFCISYLLISLLALYHFSHLEILPGPNWSLKSYWANTRGMHYLGGLLTFMDRTDRILIGFLFPTNFLGQYAVMSTLLSIFRFLPDSLSRFAVSRGNIDAKIGEFRFKLQYVGVIPLSFIFIFFSQELIRNLLGEIWLLPWYVSAIFVFQEIIRGQFQIEGNRYITAPWKTATDAIFWSVPVMAIVFTLAFTFLFGISGVPIAFITAYALSIAKLRRGEPDEKSVSFSSDSNVQ